MASPMQSAAADDLNSIEQFLNGIDSSDLVSGFEQMAAEKTNKMKLTWRGKTATRAQRTMTIRLTPELQKNGSPLLMNFQKRNTLLPVSKLKEEQVVNLQQQ